MYDMALVEIVLQLQVNYFVMDIPKISSTIEELEFVNSAGAAPTDIGNIPCFQVKVEAIDLTDKNKDCVTEIVRETAGKSPHNDADLQVIASKEVSGDLCCFWVLLYDSFGSYKEGQFEYDVVQYNTQEGIATVVEKDQVDPTQSIQRVQLSEVPIDLP